jgi:CMP/dCMP kinase
LLAALGFIGYLMIFRDNVMTLVVAIDGPAGTGKSSVAKSLAHKFNFIYVDTGAIYRALAFLVDKNHKNPENVNDVVALINQLSIVIDEKTHSSKIVIDNQTLESELRTENISRLSSIVSQHPRVREALLPVQRALVQKITNGAIFEGRDIGTVVFPLAPLKIFITANSETRASRRYEEIKLKSPDASYDDILHGIQKRDERDEKRETAPMHLAHDGHLIDSSHMTLPQVIDEAAKLILDTKKRATDGKKLW